MLFQHVLSVATKLTKQGNVGMLVPDSKLAALDKFCREQLLGEWGDYHWNYMILDLL